MPAAADPDDVGDYLISARSFAEYRAMFDLADDDLHGAILDCPGGGSGFTAGARAAGAAAVAADPVYATPVAELAARVLAETDRGSIHTAAGFDRYNWDFYGDVDGHRRVRRESAQVFAADLRAHPERYVAASLPALPFADAAYDLVLTSHFLFTYADRLDFAFHRATVRELYRVCRGQLRVFPLLDQAGRSVRPLVEALLADLAADTIPAEVRTVGYEFQRGGDQLLVVG